VATPRTTMPTDQELKEKPKLSDHSAYLQSDDKITPLTWTQVLNSFNFTDEMKGLAEQQKDKVLLVVNAYQKALNEHTKANALNQRIYDLHKAAYPENKSTLDPKIRAENYKLVKATGDRVDDLLKLIRNTMILETPHPKKK
jgi:hypothetical protein